MNSAFLETVDGIAERWSAWMLGLSWQVAVVAIALTLLTWLFRRRSAVLLHALWLLVLLRLVVPPSFAFPTGWGWWLLPPAETEPVAAADAPAEALSGDLLSPDRTQTASAAPAIHNAESPATSAHDFAATPSSSPAAPVDQSRWPVSVGLILMLCWLAVVSTLLGLLALGQWRVTRWVRRARPLDDPVIWGILEDSRERLGIRRRIEVRNSEACSTPLVVGLFRPVILLPTTVSESFSTDELEAVLVHELHHVARHDALVNLLQGMLGALYFFHPLVWWANAWIRRLREEACDELTVQTLDGRRKAYGEAILKTSQILGYAPPPLAMGIMESQHPAKRRLLRILDPRLPLGGSRWTTAAAVLVVALILLPASGRQATDAGETTLATAEDGRASRNASNTDAETPTLRYRWTPGTTHTWSFKLTAERSDSSEIHQGSPTLNVRPGAGGTSTLVLDAYLPATDIPHPNQSFDLRPPRFPRTSPPSGRGPLHHELETDDRGRILAARGTSELPFALGSLADLLILPLPNAPRRAWTSSQVVDIRRDDEDPADPFGPRLGPTFGPRFGPSFGSDYVARPVNVLTADRRIECSLDRVETDTVVIVCRHTLRSRKSTDGHPAIELTLAGTAVFNRTQGLVRTLDLRGQFVETRGNITERIPVTLRCDLQIRENDEHSTDNTEPASTVPPNDDSKSSLLPEVRPGD